MHPSIVKVPDSSKKSVLEVIPPPQLHLLLGPVNTMYKALADRWEKVGDWLEAITLVARLSTTEVLREIPATRFWRTLIYWHQCALLSAFHTSRHSEVSRRWCRGVLRWQFGQKFQGHYSVIWRELHGTRNTSDSKSSRCNTPCRSISWVEKTWSRSVVGASKRSRTFRLSQAVGSIIIKWNRSIIRISRIAFWRLCALLMRGTCRQFPHCFEYTHSICYRFFLWFSNCLQWWYQKWVRKGEIGHWQFYLSLARHLYAHRCTKR